MSDRIVEFSLMAGAAYVSTRGEINRIHAPSGWEPLNPRAGLDHRTDPANGFEAAAFVKGNEIVIAFAGTDFPDLTGDWLQANAPLFSGAMSPQLLKAAAYYQDIKSVYTGYQISFRTKGVELKQLKGSA